MDVCKNVQSGCQSSASTVFRLINTLSHRRYTQSTRRILLRQHLHNQHFTVFSRSSWPFQSSLGWLVLTEFLFEIEKGYCDVSFAWQENPAGQRELFLSCPSPLFSTLSVFWWLNCKMFFFLFSYDDEIKISPKNVECVRLDASCQPRKILLWSQNSLGTLSSSSDLFVCLVLQEQKYFTASLHIN